MKRFLLGSSSQAAQTETSQQAGANAYPPVANQAPTEIVMGIKPSPSQHAALSLTHLRKLFSDFNSVATQTMTESERESRMYSMLPLFCRVFSHCPASEMLEKFPEVGSFCQQVSRLAVSEIRRRASNQSTVAASQAIAGFLEMEEFSTNAAQESNGNGWMLLTCLNLLSLGGPGLIEIMTAASVPSTLVKCLYLFFDLPDLENSDTYPPGCEFTPRERRQLLQKSFGQMLIRLCSVPAATEELARKDDLTLLFSALSSWCPQHNLLWRKNANEVLVVLTRHGLTAIVLGYIHNKGCVSLCVENMQKASGDLLPLEVVEMFATVFCLLKDSADVTQTLLDDFRSCQGYNFLTEFMLRAEHDTVVESQEALRNLVFLVSSLSTCGFHEVRPMAFSTGSLFQLPNFSIPTPLGKGSSVRNIAAFQVLHSAFIKSTTSALASVILDAVSTIFHSDPANYFILESQNTLNQFAEKIHLKGVEVQEKYFRLLEFVVFQLNYVPCKELISLSLLLRNHAANYTQCSIQCMVVLLTILRHHAIFKDVYREVGLLEVLVTCLQRFASVMKLKSDNDSSRALDVKHVMKEPDREKDLGYLVMECLGVLLVGNANNAAVFRESGGARCAHNLIPFNDCRKEALCLVQQLVLSTGGDDDMGTVLGLLQSAPATDLALKMDILKSLLTCLRESHRTRTMFRKVGAFVYIMSALVSVEGCLHPNPADAASSSNWENVAPQEILRLLHLIFNTLCVAMRYEPANAKFFQQEICGPSLCDTIRLLGCFDQHRTFDSPDDVADTDQPETAARNAQHGGLHQVFNRGVQEFEEEDVKNENRCLVNATLVMRLLYDLAVDSYDRAQTLPVCCAADGKNLQRSKSSDDAVCGVVLRRPLSFNPINSNPDPILVHPGVVLAMFQLLPSIWTAEDIPASRNLQLLVTEIIQSLTHSERNVQILCDAGFPFEILKHASSVVNNESRHLHGPLLTVLEQLARQALEPKDLRCFLRMGNPLNCLLPELSGSKIESDANGAPLPLYCLKSLVSMSTPKDVGRCGGHQGVAFSPPPFVEFDMQPEGFGCLFLPSVAPQCQHGGGASGSGSGGAGGAGQPVSGQSGSSSQMMMGGVGSGGDRVFPAPTGMSYSTWICVDKFSDPRLDPHGIRLLTLVRNVMERPDDNLVCLSVVLSPRDKALLVSTQETPLPKGSSDWEPEVSGDFGARIWNPDLIQEGHWHHLALVWSRAVLKNSQFSLYIDGQLVHTGKMHYISQNPGGGAANLTVASSVFGYIGTAPSWRRQSRLVWRQGPCHLVEDAFNPQVVQWIYRIGPHYVGSLQAPQLPGSAEALCSLVNEERIVFGLNASAMSPLTLAKIRKVYRKTDSRSVAKQLGMSSHENATPIRLLHNAAGHLSGPARTLGGVVIGYLGVRVFCPRPICTTVQAVGGCNVLLGLVAMATDVESLYAAVKALVYVVKCNGQAQHEMERIRGYQTLAYLLKRHKAWLNNHILQLILVLVGFEQQNNKGGCEPNNSLAFRDLLADLDVWRETADDLLKVLFDLFYRMAAESGSDGRSNTRYLRDLNLVGRLVEILHHENNHSTGVTVLLSASARETLWNLLGWLLHNSPRPIDLLLYGQYLATTLPVCISDDKNVTGDEGKLDDSSPTALVASRNEGLTLLFKLLLVHDKGVINQTFAEEFLRVLGFEWLLLFLQPQVKSSTVILSANCLLLLLSNPQFLVRFREGVSTGAAWTRSRDLITSQGFSGSAAAGPLRLVGRTFSVASDEVATSPNSSLQNQQLPGFQLLGWMLVNHTALPEIYYLIIGLMIGKPQLRTSSQLDLETIWSCLFGVSQAQPIASLGGRGVTMYCPEAITILLTMMRAIMNPEDNSTDEASNNYPNVLLQFLFYVYNNAPDYMSVFMTPDLLSAMVASLFPIGLHQQHSLNSEPNTPIEEYNRQFVMVESTVDAGKDPLTFHRAKKTLMDFLRTIVIDSLSLAVTNGGTSTTGGSNMNLRPMPIIDVIMDACPDSASYNQHCQFQTDLLSIVMDYLSSAGVILGEQGVLPIVTQNGGSLQNVPTNVFYLAGRLVDKLWLGVLSRDAHHVFDFIVQLITQAKKRSTSTGSHTNSSSNSSGLASLSLDNIYRCLNRCILYLLSRPADTISEQMSLLEALHKLTNHRSLIFGSGNHDLEFIGCLCYCLLQLTLTLKISTEPSRTTWHVSGEETDPSSSLREAQHLAAVAAQRVWEELYVSKKPAVEEAFKISLGANTQHRAPSLELVREPALKLWLQYVEAERRSAYRTVLEVSTPNQIQSKIQKVTGGLTRLTSRSLTMKSSKKEDAANAMSRHSHSSSNSSCCWADVWLSTQYQLAGLKEQLELERRQRQQALQHVEQFNRLNWKKVEETELLRVRGLWGPSQESRLLTKWMLDMTEGPCRMRKKLTPNRHFYALYPYRPELELAENKSMRYKVATSLDAKEHFKLYSKWRQSLLLEEDQVDQVNPAQRIEQSPVVESAADELVGRGETILAAPQLQDLPQLLRPIKREVQANQLMSMADIDEEVELIGSSPATDEPLTSAVASSAHQQPQDWQNLMRLLEENEKIGHLFRSARVQGLETVDGLLLFGKEHLYVVDGFTQTPSRDIRDISNFPSGTFEPIVPPYTTPGYGSSGSSNSNKQELKAVHQCSRLGYEDIREVHKRRYLLQPIALEIFSNDGRNHLLAFPPNVRNKVYQRLLATATGLSDSASQSVAGQKRAANVEQSAGLLSTMTAGLMGETSVTQRWVRGELSNFQYLMHLNTLAGRSYNDLMQYPVFPWVLSDYDSAELDLSQPSTFRDLSKPMGAQTADRLQQFRKRYKEWDDPHNETGPYHYGTHYSSAMIVCSYLVRLEPFTQQFLQLQGGHFDLADRLFHSIREAWWSAAQLNMADVKELIPEFYYLPDFLVNANRFDLGCKQSGVALDDVVLPPWAKNDPREFIRLHRAALESDYVSQHLHEWIDLIFGYKQQGPAAVESINLFHPLFYEGNVDIYSIEDPLKKNAVIGFINNFGQTPKQLFKKPHPSKKVGGAGSRMSGLEMALPLAGQAAMQILPLLPSASGFHSTGSAGSGASGEAFFHHVDHLSPSLQAIKELKRPVGHMIGAERSVVAVEENKCLLPPNYSRCVAWGYADHSIRLVPHDSDKALMVCETPFHQEILTCVCPTGRTVVTGGANTVVTVWDLGKKQFTIRQNLYGHTEAVTCLAASAGYQILVSGSRDRTAIVWDLSRLTFIRQLTGHIAPLAAIDINDLTGDIATCSGTWLHLWSINGDPLASVNTLVGQIGRSQHILCVCFSQFNEWDPMNVILTGSTDGVVRMWSLDYVQVPNEEIPAQVKEEVVAEVAKLVEESGEDSPDDADLPGEMLQRPASMCSLPSSGSSGHEGPESTSSPVPTQLDEENQQEQAKALQTSRSDCSLNGTFEMISESEVRESAIQQQQQQLSQTAKPSGNVVAPFVVHQPGKKSRHILKEGFKWQRQLIFRTKLTMHTAYDRQDNSEPASITSLAISKDHRTVLVGDARGRIHSWSVTDASGRSVADHWLRDDTAEVCSKCRVKFSLTERRHHCRNCGHVFCSRCSRYESEIMQLRIRRPVRVCQDCYASLKMSSEGTS